MEEKYYVYILLSHTGSNFSKAISFYTKKPYSHASISLNKELTELYSFGRLRPYNPIIGGFVKEEIDSGTFKRFKNTRCALYALNITHKQHLQLKDAISNFNREADKYRYNFLGVIGAVFNYPVERKYKYFCSQFVSKVLLDSDINLIDKDPGLTEPMDFTLNPNLELIYEGMLNECRN